MGPDSVPNKAQLQRVALIWEGCTHIVHVWSTGYKLVPRRPHQLEVQSNVLARNTALRRIYTIIPLELPAEAYLESIQLFAILVACRAWGHLWQRKRLHIYCDNLTVVQAWRSGMSRSPHLMHLLRDLFYTTTTHNFHVNIAHIPCRGR